MLPALVRAVLQRLVEPGLGHAGLAREVGDRAGHAHRAMHGAGAHAAAVDRLGHHAPRRGIIVGSTEEDGFSRVEARYQYGAPGKISWRISMKYPILLLGVSKLFFIIIPFYYLVAYPIAYLLNWMDVSMKHPTGTGLIVKAWK